MATKIQKNITGRQEKANVSNTAYTTSATSITAGALADARPTYLLDGTN